VPDADTAPPTSPEDGDAATAPDPTDAGTDAGSLPPGKVPPRGALNTLDVGSWNIEWLGETTQGPPDEALQLQNARDVLMGSDLDIWGVAEVVSNKTFDEIKKGMPGFDGFLANDARVTNGADYYDETEQKVGVLFRSSAATFVSASLVLTAQAASFAGRPPLEVRLTVNLGGVTRDLSLLVLHMKAFDDAESWEKRKAASVALKAYLDGSHATDDVIVVGDFNDTVKGSIVSGKDSPYQNFVTDADYRFATDALTVGTTVGRTTAIDHHLLTNELFGRYVVGSAEAYRVDMFIADFASTTSDHYPVLSRYHWK
jgi:endonuclease/exonuclease/phosphatase family metal-dependent hydrolase